MKSLDEQQDRLFYDDPYEVLVATIARSGKSLKEIAGRVYPGTNLDTAKSKLSRALAPDNHDVHLSIEMILAILDMTNAELFVNYICDRYGFKRPKRLHRLTDGERLKAFEDRVKEKGLDVLFGDLL